MVAATVHYKFNIGGDLTEFANNQLVANKIEMIKNVFFKIMDINRIIIVCIISHNDVGIFDNIFQKCRSRRRRNGVQLVRIGMHLIESL